jgi:hypothetical protein
MGSPRSGNPSIARTHDGLPCCTPSTSRPSAAGVLRILRRAIHDVHLPIASLVAAALVDSYHRSVKDSRDYPKKKSNFPGHSPPIIRIATKKLAQKAQQLKGLTA